MARISFDGAKTPPGSRSTQAEIPQLLVTAVTRWGGTGIFTGWCELRVNSVHFPGPRKKEENRMMHLYIKGCTDGALTVSADSDGSDIISGPE